MFFGAVPGAETSDVQVSDAVHAAVHGRSVALVCMPWGSIETPSIAIGLLKRYAQAAGFLPQLYYLNIRFAERIGLRLYEQIARAGYFQTEWFFSQALFGPRGTGEIKNGWQDLLTDPGARPLVDNFTQGVGLSMRECERLALEQVPAFIDECATAIDWSQYMAVGFTTTFAQSLASLLLAKRIKEQHPDVKIMVGGANVDSEMGVEAMRAFDWIDFVAHGEAEHSFPQLLHQIAAGTDEPIAGVSMRHAGQIRRGDLTPPPAMNMNDIPAPDYSDYIVEMELTGFRKEVPITLWYESSRGCWWGAKHHCTFCGLNHDGMTYRKKDAAKVYAEIVDLANRYRCLRLAATDNILANEYFTELLPKLAALDSDLWFFYEVKANLRREQLQLMANAGILMIQPGIESFNSRVLRLMRKGTTAIQNIQLLKWCHELGIQVNYNVLYRFPQETAADYEDLATIFLMVGHLRPPENVVPLIVERFSPYYDNHAQYNLTYRPWEEYDYIYPASRVDIPKIAYFFHGTWPDHQGDPGEYIAPAKAVWHDWRAHTTAGAVICHYEKGPDYVRIADNRPRVPGGGLQPRTFDLNERLSALFVFCDEHRSFQAIVTMMQARFGNDTTEAMVRKWLDELIGQWLMFREGDRYLTLPTRKRARRAPMTQMRSATDGMDG